MPGGLKVIDACDRRERQGCALTAVHGALARGERVAWVVPSRDAALAVRRTLADSGRGLPGVEVATLEDWARDRWALYGDGRAPLNAMQRRLLVKKALDEGEWSSASLSSAGMAGCLCDIVAAGAGVAAFEEGPTPEQAAGLTQAQGELMEACRAYFGLVRSHSLVEVGSSMHALARSMPPAGWPHVVLDGCHELEGAALELVVAACTHAGVTLVGCLGANAAFEPERAVACALEGQARQAGVEVGHASGGEFLQEAAGEAISGTATDEQAESRASRHVASASAVAPCKATGKANGAPACEAGATSRTSARTASAAGGAQACAPCTPPSPHARPRSPELVSLADALFAETRAPQVESAGAVRACLPAGHYAQGPLLARQIAQLVERDGIAPRDIVVAAPDPLAMARALEGPLAEHAPRGIAVAVSAPEHASRSLAAAFVLGWMHLLEAAQDGPDEPAPQLRAQASDLARNPYMCLAQADAFKLDRTWRARRLTSARAFVDALCDLLESQAGCEGARQAHKDLAWVLAMLQARLPQSARPEDAFERACANGISRAAQTWGDLMGTQPRADDLEWLLGSLSAPLSWVSVPASDIAAQRQARVLQASPKAVRVVRLGDLDALEARAVVLCDLTADAYPLREQADVKGALWQALGLQGGPGQVAELRRRFRAAVEAAGDAVVVERPLADAEAKPLRPCALLEELVDCYRDDPSDLGGLDRATGLPTSGAIPCMTMGEEGFSRLASPVAYTPAQLPCPPAAFALDDPELAALLADPDALWSPSGLEALVNCPMRWLHERRLPSDGLDVPFDDPRSRGTFCHLVLERFHATLQERAGLACITHDTPRDLWEGAFDEAFRLACDEQPRAERPLMPVGELERARLRAIRRELASCVEREADMPEGFVPAGSEVPFGQDGSVTLGGVRVRGVIDRIDVDEAKGALLVVDYKGSLDAGHGPVQPKRGEDEAAPRDPLPRHSQILMYMAAARQVRPDLALAGGLYVSYKKPVCSGFLDPALAGPVGDERDAYLQRKRCVPPAAPDGTPGLEAALARVDEAVRQAVAELRQGRVEARPRFGKDSCLYCPLAGTCPGKAM